MQALKLLWITIYTSQIITNYGTRNTIHQVKNKYIIPLRHYLHYFMQIKLLYDPLLYLTIYLSDAIHKYLGQRANFSTGPLIYKINRCVQGQHSYNCTLPYESENPFITLHGRKLQTKWVCVMLIDLVKKLNFNMVFDFYL